ncbi:hypothetical protein QR680_005349 [Steinernema hermaphroditum]|uniref:Uncharacterized protein n=1 Tax=Steinernema hermaphroditum TaxID=289476 RepID=A0AA39HT33_9BILA|nr:hypothetical protein QR680_005349 [Steinernema hermaphroditum]
MKAEVAEDEDVGEDVGDGDPESEQKGSHHRQEQEYGGEEEYPADGKVRRGEATDLVGDGRKGVDEEGEGAEEDDSHLDEVEEGVEALVEGAAEEHRGGAALDDAAEVVLEEEGEDLEGGKQKRDGAGQVGRLLPGEALVAEEERLVWGAEASLTRQESRWRRICRRRRRRGGRTGVGR